MQTITLCNFCCIIKLKILCDCLTQIITNSGNLFVISCSLMLETCKVWARLLVVSGQIALCLC